MSSDGCSDFETKRLTQSDYRVGGTRRPFRLENFALDLPQDLGNLSDEEKSFLDKKIDDYLSQILVGLKLDIVEDISDKIRVYLRDKLGF